jgi:hypothetical protein
MYGFRARITTGILAALFLATTASFVAAQEEDEGDLYTISFWKVRFDKLDEVLETWEDYFSPIQAEIPEVKSVKVFRHFWGPDWNLMVVTEYEDLTAMEQAEKKFEELFEKRVPDEAKRKEIMNVTGSYALGHWDAIVTELPKLSKD